MGGQWRRRDGASLVRLAGVMSRKWPPRHNKEWVTGASEPRLINTGGVIVEEGLSPSPPLPSSPAPPSSLAPLPSSFSPRSSSHVLRLFICLLFCLSFISPLSSSSLPFPHSLSPLSSLSLLSPPSPLPPLTPRPSSLSPSSLPLLLLPFPPRPSPSSSSPPPPRLPIQGRRRGTFLVNCVTLKQGIRDLGKTMAGLLDEGGGWRRRSRRGRRRISEG